ncbi:U2 small nuclear ribonucleoprotein, putative [Eimeria brunetti]|uniref:U2 small nuclear ribonucleoprotein, putative n=1 Tax=Eimeria brunetti TaxID=51314 RepID=U6LTU1_9EIME|nr:U2 small nuclear ribonucleoprotein, putative [Eimeria brunetti]
MAASSSTAAAAAPAPPAPPAAAPTQQQQPPPPAPAPAPAPAAAAAAPAAAAAAGGGAPLSLPDFVPNPTLYLSNLNDRLPLQELRACLYELCCCFGWVLAVHAGGKHRGQAFVVFSDLTAAAAALKGLQGKPFLGRPLKAQYAKAKSDAYLKFIDQFKPRKPNAPRNNTALTANKPSSLPSSAGRFSLFLESLPPSTSRGALEVLFGQFAGFAGVRLVEGRGVAFADFAAKEAAEAALLGLQGFKLTQNHALKISHVER